MLEIYISDHGLDNDPNDSEKNPTKSDSYRQHRSKVNFRRYLIGPDGIDRCGNSHDAETHQGGNSEERTDLKHPNPACIAVSLDCEDYNSALLTRLLLLRNLRYTK